MSYLRVFSFVYTFAVVSGVSAQEIRYFKYPVQTVPAAVALEVFKKEGVRNYSAFAFRELPPRSARDALDAIQKGEAELAIVSTIALAQLERAYDVFELPFLFSDLGAVYRFQTREGGEILRKRLLERGLALLGFVHDGMSVIMSKYQIRTLADLKSGKYVGLPNDPITPAMLEKMGVGVVAPPTNPAQVLPWLIEGRTDGFIGVPTFLAYANWQSIKGSVTPTRHSYAGFALVANPKFVNGLNKQARDALASAVEAGQLVGNSHALDRLANLDANLRKAGINVLPVKEQELEQWRRVTRPTWTQFDAAIGNGLIDLAVAASGTWGGGDPCRLLSECKCPDRSCSRECCSK